MSRVLSIVTVNFNGCNDLVKTIESIRSQTFKDFEYLIIDGGSTDDSKKVIEENSDIIDSWVSEKDKGIYDAMNKGIAAATGQYILFLNSGDVLIDTDVLAQVVPALDGQYDMVYGDILLDRGNKIERISYPDQLDFTFLFEKVICHQAQFIKREVFSRVGPYDTGYKLAADWIHFVKCVTQGGCTYRHLPIPVIQFDLGGASAKPANQDLIWQERFHFFETHFPEHYPVYKEMYYNHTNQRYLSLQQLEKNTYSRKAATALLQLMAYVKRTVLKD